MRAHEIINEISIFDERELLKGPWKNPSEVYSWLVNKGFHEIGEGYFSKVLMHPRHNRVVKISSITDACWLSYAHHILEQPTPSPHFPKIYWVHSYGEQRDYKSANPSKNKLFISVIEKLSEFNVQQHLSTLAPQDLAALDLSGFSLMHDEYKRLVGAILAHPKVADINPYFSGIKNIDRFSEEERLEQALVYLDQAAGMKNTIFKRFIELSAPTSFIEALHELEALRGDCGIDLHSGNLMWREKTQSVVINDPWAFYGPR